MRRLCVFCGSRPGDRPVYAEQARRLGAALAARGIGLVYGGGHIGLMGVVADAVLAGGGEAVGVIPRSMVESELAHAGLTALHVVETMHQRKALMADLADGFAALPGAFGTGDETFEILTWRQLRIHAKPVGLLNTEDFFTPLLTWLDHAVREGFLKAKHRGLLLEAKEPEALLEMLVNTGPRRSRTSGAKRQRGERGRSLLPRRRPRKEEPTPRDGTAQPWRPASMASAAASICPPWL